MTSPDKAPPREWWLINYDYSGGYETYADADKAKSRYDGWADFSPVKMYHVVEKSAYDALVIQLYEFGQVCGAAVIERDALQARYNFAIERVEQLERELDAKAKSCHD